MPTTNVPSQLVVPIEHSNKRATDESSKAHFKHYIPLSLKDNAL